MNPCETKGKYRNMDILLEELILSQKHGKVFYYGSSDDKENERGIETSILIKTKEWSSYIVERKGHVDLFINVWEFLMFVWLLSLNHINS
ncbi:hypothetical protein TNIN_341441 [Trichonephila inaurata madagascariensis]|uniref:Uncharacterized protein n=1 Tax=Trichonephila inaurata madagascariensis TaxID=2747483 RepID=A0A8X7CJE3_9ARAC|nr:hypothetical protein TNIN_341441 [Trichonephila inaurata madagascariensis]